MRLTFLTLACLSGAALASPADLSRAEALGDRASVLSQQRNSMDLGKQVKLLVDQVCMNKYAKKTREKLMKKYEHCCDDRQQECYKWAETQEGYDFVSNLNKGSTAYT